MKKFFILIFFILFFVSSNSAFAIIPREVDIISRQKMPFLQLQLDDDVQENLKNKKEIRVAIYPPQNPPFSIMFECKKFEGISADYMFLIAHYLGLKPRVLLYPSRQEALEALSASSVDMVISDAGELDEKNEHFSHSAHFMPKHLALVSRKMTDPNLQQNKTSIRLALSQNYVDQNWLKNQFPNANISRYSSVYDAISSVAFGDNDYFLGNLASANFFIENNYKNILNVVHIYFEQRIGSYFLMQKNDPLFLKGVNTVLKSIPITQRQSIFRQWSQRFDARHCQFSSLLTEKEKEWIEQNRQQKVLVNPLYSPFTFFDESSKFHGISADILELIHLRTGLDFLPVKVHSVTEMMNFLQKGKGDIISAVSYSHSRNQKILLTRPYLSSPTVLVTRDTPISANFLSNNIKLAVTSGSHVIEWLRVNYPKIMLIPIENTTLALEMLERNKVDGVVYNLIGANYMIDHYFRGKLKIAKRLSELSSVISFGVNPDNTELNSILNKALIDISPREISLILNKWQDAPDVKLYSWNFYSTEFYLLAALFSVLVLTSLMWIYYLRREILSRHTIQLKLQEEVTLRETLLNSIPVPVYVVDRDGYIINRNQAWNVFFEQKKMDLTEFPLSSFSHPLSAVYPSLQNIFKNPSIEKTVSAQRYTVNNGLENRIILHQAVPFIDRTGQPAGLICSWQDMTLYENLLKILSITRERAEQANRAKSTFLATMSHEIRTPISAIIGLLELVVTSKEHVVSDDEPIYVAYQSAQSLLGLIGDILDMAKIESGKLELNPAWVSFHELILPVVKVFDGLARQKNLRLSCEIKTGHPDEVYIDPMRFRQVLSNLLSNAIKFTEIGSVDVLVKCISKKEPLETHQIQRLEVKVKDTGVGISQADQKLVFQPYSQSDFGKKQSGTGLGLSICLQLMQMMNGSIKLNSELHQGTCVELSVPIQCRANIHQAKEEKQLISENVQKSFSLRILVVDDHPANRLLLKSQLTRLGHQVVVAENGVQALELWKNDVFDVVITDCSMPVMDGPTLTRHLREASKGPLIILGLTAHAREEEKVAYLAAGMDDCLFKPLRLSQLDAWLNKLACRLEKKAEPLNTLNNLVSMETLNQFTQKDPVMLRELLMTTRDENISDMKQAKVLLEEAKWPGFTQCLHRIAGALHIIGANELAGSCRELEKECQKSSPNKQMIEEKFETILKNLEEINRAIFDTYLK
ncbi:transporter substrate-binding domain-containing protein [Candidatus Williamhamiltonella defendens]|uniref:transporter substrate-binding domain-containing protein n=1 Tax=Candidatus Williamhamiltonella defendens TaxID=138072 RepID=UPI001582D8DD|nr:transporter substrate-binding domain-containing protein [Candidatus Hamiltonella defensa]